MKAEDFLKDKSDWFDKSPGGEKLYFESEVIRMMNEYANEALRIHAVSVCACGSTKYYSEQYKDVTKYFCSNCHEKIKSKH